MAVFLDLVSLKRPNLHGEMHLKINLSCSDGEIYVVVCDRSCTRLIVRCASPCKWALNTSVALDCIGQVSDTLLPLPRTGGGWVDVPKRWPPNGHRVTLDKSLPLRWPLLGGSHSARQWTRRTAFRQTGGTAVRGRTMKALALLQRITKIIAQV